MRVSRTVVAASAAVVLVAGASVALGQAPGVKRTVLQRFDVGGPEEKECVFGSADVAPGASIGKHVHPGTEVGYVVEGEGDLTVEGEGTRHVRAGDSYRIGTRIPHDARNTGGAPMKVIATWVVEKGKPFAEPVK